MQYDNTDSGVLFYQDKKSEKAPDYTGIFNLNGEDIRIAGWQRVSKAGKEFISLKKDTYVPPIQQVKPDVAIEDISDEPIDLSEIPF